MPPVFGPVSPSPMRLKSCAGSSGDDASSPSVTQNSDTSGPSRYSSITTRPQAAAWAQRLVEVVGDDDALAGGQPVVLDHVGRPELGRAPPRPRRASVHTYAPRRSARRPPPSRPWRTPCCPRVGPPRRTGRSRRCRRARTASATPATSGASGPITTRSASTSTASAATAAGSSGSTPRCSATAAVPALPGAQTSAVTAGSAARARQSACSRAPDPITRLARKRLTPAAGRGRRSSRRGPGRPRSPRSAP